MPQRHEYEIQMRLARLERMAGADSAESGPYRFAAEISNDGLDSHYSRMDEATLRNFAAEAADGVQFLDSHNSRNLGYGRSVGGAFIDDGQRQAVRAEFSVVRGVNFANGLTYASTDDFIRAVEGGTVNDVSVGFYGGREVCDICGRDVWHFWERDACPHIPGVEYAVGEQGAQRVMATYTIKDAHLAEVSAVYAGATPGAMIEKMRHEAQRGRIGPADVALLERRYRTKLPAATGKTGRSSAETGAIMELEQALRDVLQLTPDQDVLAQVRQLVESQAELQALAAQGRAWRAQLIDQALAEGVRAMGGGFAAETYRGLLERAPVDVVQRMAADWAAVAQQRLQGGRQSVDAADKPGPARKVVPDAVYQG